MRGYEKRRLDRISRLRDRLAFLNGRLESGASRHEARDKAEASALTWALEEIERFNVVEMALHAPELHTDAAKLTAISAAVNARHEPSAADLARTKALARLYGWERLDEGD